MENKIKIIKSFSLFSKLSETESRIIAEKTKEQQIDANTVFIEQGDIAGTTYFIISGSVRIFRMSEGGEETNLAILGKGEVVGELSLIDDEPRSAYVQTLQETHLLLLSKSDFKQILNQHPEIALGLLKTLSQRVRITNEYVEDVLSKDLYERTWKMLQTLVNYFPEREITLSQEELAEIIGGTRARITEILNHLKDQGKISLAHKKITLS